MLAQQRRELILKELEEFKIINSLKIAEKYDVAIETIRRDLDHMEKQGLLKKIYGGATILENKMVDLDYMTRMNLDISDKIEIAKKAINFINEGDTIFLNDSSINYYLSKELKTKIKNITIITNSLMIVSELSNENYTLILTGGFLNNQQKAFFGAISENIISQFKVEKAFLGVSSISLDDGITDFPLSEVTLQKAMIASSREVYILTNSKRMETTSLIKVDNFNKVKTIITNSNLNRKIYNRYKEKNIDIFY